MSKPYSFAWWIAMTAVSIAAFAAIVASEPVQAEDKWTGADKGQHVAVSAGIGTFSGLVFKDKWTAFALSMVPGVLKEVYDAQHPKTHTASFKDLAADAVGSAIGVYTGNCVIRAQSITCKVEF